VQIRSSQFSTRHDRAGENGRAEETTMRGGEPVRPRWLYPLLSLFVVCVHAVYFASGVYWPKPEIIPLTTITADLLPEGVSLEAGELAPEGDSLEGSAAPETATENENAQEPEVEPPPAVAEAVDPAPPPKPKKQKSDEKKKKAEKRNEKTVDPSRTAARGTTGSGAPREGKRGLRYGLPGGQGLGSGTSLVGGRFGVPGGRGQGSAAAQASCLAAVAGSIRRHTPPYTSLGPGTVFVTFYVNSGGGVSGISTSGGSAAHAALARRIVASARGPSSCGPAFASQSITFQ
jgi:protein TonB